ncbi:unnamed protein product [Protopolystoma xenopodis]|uniref:Uncharacterized protein n=1 Tax=Protopolystoma xenopodis TaxID=117903 RepID=A0A448X092_9PLAT|nr:unnamed protein product [Protopolystoma xenopodis]
MSNLSPDACRTSTLQNCPPKGPTDPHEFCDSSFGLTKPSSQTVGLCGLAVATSRGDITIGQLVSHCSSDFSVTANQAAQSPDPASSHDLPVPQGPNGRPYPARHNQTNSILHARTRQYQHAPMPIPVRQRQHQASRCRSNSIGAYSSAREASVEATRVTAVPDPFSERGQLASGVLSSPSPPQLASQSYLASSSSGMLAQVESVESVEEADNLSAILIKNTMVGCHTSRRLLPEGYEKVGG